MVETRDSFFEVSNIGGKLNRCVVSYTYSSSEDEADDYAYHETDAKWHDPKEE
jgi:hypothetical protein